VNEWLLSAVVLVGAMLPCLGVAAFRSMGDAVVALNVTGVLTTAALLLIAEGFHQQAFADLALVMAIITFVGSLAFLHFMESEM
jgi:multisubunit Na+/H+ antiporter MnhF subunit